MKGIGGEGSARSLCPYGHIRPKPIPYFSLHVRTLASGLDWSHSAINKYSVQPRSALLLQLVSSSRGRFPPRSSIRAGVRECGQKVLQLLPQFIHHTDTLQNEAGGAAAPRPSPGREAAGSQAEVICFRSYQSHSLETGNGFALCPPPSPSSSSIATSSSS